jgi:hypothetical protein
VRVNFPLSPSDFALDRRERDSSVALLPQNDRKGKGQNDKRRRAQNDDWMLINALACIIMAKTRRYRHDYIIQPRVNVRYPPRNLD